MASAEPESVWSLGATLGEGPVWVARDGALWFVDIKAPAVHRFDPASGERCSWAAPEPVGFVAPAAGGGFVAGLASGLARFDPGDGSFVPIAPVEPDLPGNRLNDATVDAAGRLWFGTMDDAERDATGAFYRLDEGGAVRRVGRACVITNGPAVSPDGRTLYHVDTLGRSVFACALSPDGTLGEDRVFATIADDDGWPDGPSVDAEGCVWIGLYGGWSARRYAPDGALLATIRFPVANVTKLAFGGDDLRTVYATTARQGLSADALVRQPQAGDLFTFRVAVPGIASNEVSIGI